METMEPNQPLPPVVTEAEALADFAHARALAVKALPAEPKKLAVHVPERDDFYAQRAARFAEREQQLKRAARQQEWRSLVASAGARYADTTLETYKVYHDGQKAAVAAVRDYIGQESAHGLLLFGKVGTGKDHLAFSVCRATVARGKTAGWVNGQSWFGKLRDNMDTNKSEANEISELSKPYMLCISDPLPPAMAKGDELTPYQSSMLYRLVDARYVRGLPTILTVNVIDDAEADRRIGTATWDRLCHGSWKIYCGWPSHRTPTRKVNC